MQDGSEERAGAAEPKKPARAITSSLKGLEHLLDRSSEDYKKIRDRDFPELESEQLGKDDIKVVLFDSRSVDSFAACHAAYLGLGERARYIGISRTSSPDVLFDDFGLEEGEVIAMLDVAMALDDMHNLAYSCGKVFVLETHSPTICELRDFNYETVVRIFDVDMSIGALAWNFFCPGSRVPPLVRALEDAELGRKALLNSAAFADGFVALGYSQDYSSLHGQLEVRDVDASANCFQCFSQLLGEDGGESVMQRAIEAGLEEGAVTISEACREAEEQYTVQTLTALPSWLCAVVNLCHPFDGRVAEHLAATLASRVSETARHRCVGVVFQVTTTARSGAHVRAVLRSLPGGPDVSELAGFFGGSGRPCKAFFSTAFSRWERLWQTPVPILWDEVIPRSEHCVPLRKGELVTIAWQGERVNKTAPSERWSWGYKTPVSHQEALVEGWIPTTAHVLYIAPKNVDSRVQGVSGMKVGDMVIGRQEQGHFLLGRRYRAGQPDDADAWFDMTALLPIHAHAGKIW